MYQPDSIFVFSLSLDQHVDLPKADQSICCPPKKSVGPECYWVRCLAIKYAYTLTAIPWQIFHSARSHSEFIACLPTIDLSEDYWS